MTRFARARGSKSSNKREPEEATSWQYMKQSLVNNTLNTGAATEKEQEIIKCKETVKQLKQDTNVAWSTFEEDNREPNNVCIKKKKKDKNDESKINGNNKNEMPKKKKKKNVVNEEGKSNENSAVKSKKRKLESDADHCEGKNEEKKIKKLNKPVNKDDSIEKETLNTNGSNENGVMKSGKKKRKKKMSQEQKIDTTMDEKDDTSNTNDNNENVVVKSGKKKCKKKTSQEETQLSTDLKDSVEKSHQDDKNPGKSKKNKNKKEFKTRKKPEPQPYQMDINGEMVDIVTYDGFPIMKADATRLDELKKSLYQKGIPRAEIKKIMKLQRRSAEKALSRAKKRVCFNCRRSGHNLSECPVLNKGEGTGICFKCGSTEHTHFECKVVKKQDYKFAQCFICKEQGHISNQCPDNPRGLYPKGGACKLCGDVTHLKRFCPTLPKESEPTMNEFLDIEDEMKPRRSNTSNATPKKHIVF